MGETIDKSKEITKPKRRKSKKAKKFFEYKGLPIVRCGNTIYYGKMSDKFITKIEIKETKNVSNLKIGNSLSVELLSTNSDDLTSKKVLKIAKKDGLYNAIDIANAWLERALAE